MLSESIAKKYKHYVQVCYIGRDTSDLIYRVVQKHPKVHFGSSSYEFGDGDVYLESNNLKALLVVIKELDNRDDISGLCFGFTSSIDLNALIGECVYDFNDQFSVYFFNHRYWLMIKEDNKVRTLFEHAIAGYPELSDYDNDYVEWARAVLEYAKPFDQSEDEQGNLHRIEKYLEIEDDN